MTDLKTNECCDECDYRQWVDGEFDVSCRKSKCKCHQTNEKEEWEENLKYWLQKLESETEEYKKRETFRHMRDFIKAQVIPAAHQAGAMEGRKELLESMIKAFLERGKEQGDKTILWTGQEIVDVLNQIKFTNKD